MPKHIELANIEINKGQNRLCLDRVDEVEGETESLYCFVWRGTKRSSDGFVQRPAYFSFDSLGELFNKAIQENKITANQVREFLINLLVA